MQNIIQTDELNYKSKRRKVHNFTEYSLPIASLRNIHEGYSSLDTADDEQCNFAAKLNNLDEDKKTIKK